jgi:hypothetical protein
MDWMTFVVGVLKAIAWPATLLLLVFSLRRQIQDLIPLLRKLKLREFELEFSQEIAKIDVGAQSATAESILPSKVGATAEDQDLPNERRIAAPVAEAGSPSTPSREEEVLRLASLSPRSAITEAWVEVEAAATAVAASFWGPGNRPEIFRTMDRLGEYLLQCKVIDAGQLVAFNKLRELRNKAVHAEELNLSVDETRRYVELAFTLANHIRSV